MRLFKEYPKLGFIAQLTLRKLKMENAKELLLDSDMSILEIGAAVGIDDQNYFSRIFKKYCGVSPIEFRNGS